MVDIKIGPAPLFIFQPSKFVFLSVTWLTPPPPQKKTLFGIPNMHAPRQGVSKKSKSAQKHHSSHQIGTTFRNPTKAPICVHVLFHW